MARKALWHNQPGVHATENLTRGERAADRLRLAMGSWGFVLGHEKVVQKP